MYQGGTELPPEDSRARIKPNRTRPEVAESVRLVETIHPVDPARTTCHPESLAVDMQ